MQRVLGSNAITIKKSTDLVCGRVYGLAEVDENPGSDVETTRLNSRRTTSSYQEEQVATVVSRSLTTRRL